VRRGLPSRNTLPTITVPAISIHVICRILRIGREAAIWSAGAPIGRAELVAIIASTTSEASEGYLPAMLPLGSLAVGARGAVVDDGVQVDGGSMAAAEAAFDLRVFHTKLFEHSYDVRADDRERFVAGCGDAEETFEVNWFAHIRAGGIVVVGCGGHLSVRFLWHIGFSFFNASLASSLYAFSAGVTKGLGPRGRGGRARGSRSLGIGWC
jgi:hypothetical protein